MCLKDDLMQTLTDFTWDHHFGLEIGPYKPGFRSCSIPEDNLIIINTNWKNKEEVPFSFAHELGHFMNGDDGIRYYDSATINNKCERGANEFAVKFILNFCKRYGLTFSNPITFCEQFGVPTTLEDLVASYLN
mgnify:FL=1